MSTPFCVSPPNLAHRTKKHRKTCSKHRSPPLTSLPTVTPPHLMYSPVGPDDPVRPYTRLPIAFAPSVRADVGIRPYKITGGVCVIRTGGQSRPPLHTISRRQNISNRRPKAATYLCRFAAKARFDNRLTHGAGVSKEGGPQPSLFGRSRMGDFQGGRKIETSFPLEWRSLDTFFRQGKKVSCRRHPAPGRGTPLPFGKESNPSEAKKKEALGRGRAPPLRSVYQ